MRRFERFPVEVLATLAVFFFLSCNEKDGPISDTKPPEVTVTGLVDKAIVSNDVTIDVHATDDQGIDKVEIFNDGSLLKAFMALPFTTSWNTREVSEGPHVIAIKVTDKSGNQTTQEFNVQVQNVLLTFTVPTNYFGNAIKSNAKSFVLLSDSTGKAIDYVELHNGQSVIIARPASFTGSKFAVSQIIFGDAGIDGRYVTGMTFINVTAGSWSVLTPDNLPFPINEEEDEEDEVLISGTTTFHPTNIGATQSDYYVATNGAKKGSAGFDTWQGTAGDQVISLSKSPSRIFIRQAGNTTNKYYFTPTASAQSNGTFSFNMGLVNSSPKTLTRETLDFPSEYMGGKLTIFGLGAQGYPELYQVGNYYMESDQLKIEYPGNDFSTYASHFWGESPKLYINNFSLNSRYDITPVNASLHAEIISSTKVKLSVTGDYDLTALQWYKEGQGYEAEWFILHSGGANNELRLPEVPQAIVDAVTAGVSINISELVPYSLFICQYENIASYNEYMGKYAEGKLSEYHMTRLDKSWKVAEYAVDNGLAVGRLSRKPIHHKSTFFKLRDSK